MGPVAFLTCAFIVASYVFKKVCEYFEFLSKTNLKYRFLDFIADYIHYGEDIGIEASLSLDRNFHLLNRRMEGQEYLASKLSADANADANANENANADTDTTNRGRNMTPKLVDCRFKLAKVCMPLLRELEFSSTGNRNFITSVANRSQDAAAASTANNNNDDNNNNNNDGKGAKGMLQVDTEGAKGLMYVGNDAVHTLGIEAFHAPIQQEINRRMSLTTTTTSSSSSNDSKFRFTPISLTPELEKNANLILGLTGMDQVRYSLSGSEAMDAAFKDIKASCRNKKIIVRFSSAYHGHVSGVDYLSCGATHIFLRECSQESIDFIEKYHYRIAAVVVNPMQHFTGINKASPPGEKLTMGNRVREAVSRDEYARWLHALQDKCNYCTKYLTRVAFVLDDIYFAFRVPELFSKDYFIHPDTHESLRPNVMVIGKGVAAGYPLSMVLGQRGYLNTYDKKYLLQVNKTVGTLSAWHGGIVASNVFLETLSSSSPSSASASLIKIPAKVQLTQMVSKFDTFCKNVNSKFESNNLPLRIRNFSNTFSINYLNQSLYNSRYPQFVMAEGVFLGNYSTGKFNLTNDATTDDLNTLGDKLVSAGLKMNKYGYFEPMSSSAKKRLFAGLAFRFLRVAMKKYYDQIMEDKHIDIEVSHNHPVNKFGHFWSSVFMILIAYPKILFEKETLTGCLWFFLTHVVRQSGHFFYEHQDRNIEKKKFGHKDQSKKKAVVALIGAYAMYHWRNDLYTYASQYNVTIPTLELSIDQYVGLVALYTIVPHYVEITHQYGLLRGISWMMKIFTDPFTDLLDFYTHWIIHPKWFLDFKEHSATYQLDINTKKVKKL